MRKERRSKATGQAIRWQEVQGRPQAEPEPGKGYSRLQAKLKEGVGMQITI